MKVAICSVAYNEVALIEGHVGQWKGMVDRHLILVSAKPWFGQPTAYDGTVEAARAAGAEVEVGSWATEHEQRNWGLARLWDCDFVLIVDPDEFYTEDDRKKILARLEDPRDFVNRTPFKMPVFKVPRMLTYWKTKDYVFDPPDGHKPVIAVDPKKCLFYDKRETRPMDGSAPIYHYVQHVEDVTCHHFSWVKSDQKVREKIDAYSHQPDIRSDWYEKVWLAWTPEMPDIRPYGNKEQSKAVWCPCPAELR